MKLVLLVIFLGVSSTFGAPSKQHDLNAVDYQIPTITDLEERVDNGMTGIPDFIQVTIDLLTSIVGAMNGNSNIQPMVTAIQNFFFTVEKMVNIRWIVNQVPFFGPFFSLMVDVFCKIIEDAGIVGGLLSQIIRIGSGIPGFIQVTIDLLTSIVGAMNGNSNIQAMVTAIQNFFFTVEKVVNIRWIVNLVPFFGPFFSLMVDVFCKIIGDAGLLSQILVGPDALVDYGVKEETQPPTMMRKGLFG